MAATDAILIANPVSGQRRAPAKAEEVQRRLQAAGRRCELLLTTERGHAGRLAAEAVARGAGLVCVSGGDGTVQEVAAALAGTETALGIVPSGRCNDLARALGFTSHDSAERLTGIFISDRTRRIDLGGFVTLRNGAPDETTRRTFCTVATLGFDSEVNRFVEHHRLPFRGTPAYLYGVLRVLLSFRCPMVRMRGDFGEFSGRILLAATGNTPFYGGAMQIAPGAKTDDGLFQVCIVQAVPRRTVVLILPKVFSGRHVNHPAVRMVQTRRLEIETPDGPQYICADGETLGLTPAILENRPAALGVKAP